jgi:hypothetical protein
MFRNCAVPLRILQTLVVGCGLALVLEAVPNHRPPQGYVRLSRVRIQGCDVCGTLPILPVGTTGADVDGTPGDVIVVLRTISNPYREWSC